MKILHLDSNHPLLIEHLTDLGHTNHEDYNSSKKAVEAKIHLYDGLIIRSRFRIDAGFLDKATQLKFIGRVGAGLENIDTDYAYAMGVHLISAPEGNQNAVGEHALGMLLSLFNKLTISDREVRNGIWQRESNRGNELDGKTIGIIGYGHMGKAFSKKLQGFDVDVLCYDIKANVGDENSRQVPLEVLQEKAHILSLHVPQTAATINMVNTDFISSFKHPFWLLNTARGNCVVTSDLVKALESKKIRGAALDVMEYEKSSFETIFSNKTPLAFSSLLKADNVIFSPHIAGWTIESHRKLAQTIVDKIKFQFH
jgi:D-3-phosphoglycerate dehydrogenase / 2-oxoglutarate reductase|tara:strand:+ start:1463 stop:2398 length:936 start_codon:yes stop_codon:yes gene_type:complete